MFPLLAHIQKIHVLKRILKHGVYDLATFGKVKP